MTTVQQAARILSPHTDSAVGRWQNQYRDAITDPAELWRLLKLDPALLAGAIEASRLFPLRLPRRLLDRIEIGSVNDPVLMQYLPQRAETDDVAGFVTDPVGDLNSIETPGLLHKYRARALLVTTGACAVHCRYCFRRHFPYADNTRNSIDAVLDGIRQSEDISEIILSGGDPLSLSDQKLDELISRLSDIPQLQRLRLHTRTAVVVPERITDALIATLQSTRLSTVCVIHANHANEIDDAVGTAMRSLRDADVTLLNQSVLLRGVNDNPQTLAELSERLFECGVLPYYLHLLDPVAGAAHFQVPKVRATDMMAHLASLLPGYLVPKLVRETAGQPYKSPIAWAADSGVSDAHRVKG